MSYAPSKPQSLASRMRASLGGAGLHVPLQYIPPVEESTAAAEAHQDIDTPTQEINLHQAHGLPYNTHTQGTWNPAYGVAAPYGDAQMTPAEERAATESSLSSSNQSSPKSPAVHISSKDPRHSPQPSDSSDYSVEDENGYRILLGKDRWNVTVEPFVTDDKYDLGRPRSQRVKYIEGVRGLMAIQTLLWIFFRTFAPAIVTDTDVDGAQPAYFVATAPSWMNILRKVLAPVLFDGSIQMAMYIILIGRVGLLTFIERRQALNLAGQCFRRPIRIILPVALTVALISILTVTNGFRYADFMASDLHNAAVTPPLKFDTALEYFNTLMSFLFEPYAQRDSRAVKFLPVGQIAWFVDVAFQQTYIMTVFAFVLPFTIFKYKAIGFATMIVLSAWVARWSWYTVTGLVLAEFAVVYRSMLPDRSTEVRARRGDRRVSLTPARWNRSSQLAMWLVPSLMMFVGLLLRYTWTSIAPQYADKELLVHGDVTTADLATGFDPVARAYPRYDTWLFWLFCTGFLIMLELSHGMQDFFANRVFVYFARLGFSVALISGTIMISLGALLHSHLVQTLQWTNPAMIVLVEFLAIVPVCLISADIWSRLVDDGALVFSRALFKFMRT